MLLLLLLLQQSVNTQWHEAKRTRTRHWHGRGRWKRRSLLPWTGAGIACMARTHDSSVSLQHPVRKRAPFPCILEESPSSVGGEMVQKEKE